MVKRPKAAKKAYVQQRLNRLSPLTPLPSAANMRSVQTVRSHQSRGAGVETPGIALAGTADAVFMLLAPPVFPASTFLPSFPVRGFPIPRVTMTSGA